MGLFSYKYLGLDQLTRFNAYKYAAVDTSPLSRYVMHPFWNYIVEFLPMSVAPNILTLAGFAFTLMNAILLSIYDYHFYASSDSMRDTYAPIPSIVWLICAINLFLAHTLDGIDGKQARRTRATGPLGELMDHGVDSWTAVFVPLYVYSLFGSADYSFGPHRMFFLFWSVFLTFYLTHWEKYNTGILCLPWSYDLSQIFLFVCSLVTYFGTYQIWKANFPLTSLPFSKAFELLLYVGILVTLPLPAYNVYSAWRSGKSKYSSISDILRPITPLFQLFLISALWAFYSPSDVLNQDPRLFFFTMGTVFANISSRLIISQMSSTKCELVNGLVIAYAIVAVCSLVLPIASFELLLLRLLALALTLAHIHYAVCVIKQMCDYFDMNCFSIAVRETETSRQLLLGNESSTSSSKHSSESSVYNTLTFARQMISDSLQDVDDERLLMFKDDY